MIPSGSHVPGIDPDSFGLPEGTALRYERPAAALAPFFASYAMLDSDAALWRGPSSWTLPSGALLWIVLTDGPIGLQIRNRHYAQLGSAMLVGPTSRAVPVSSHGGVSILVHLRPCGWARWFDRPADHYRDRATPLDQLWPEALVGELMEALFVSDRGAGVKAVLDDFFSRHLPPANAPEDRIARATAALADPAFEDSGAVAAALDISAQTLLRLSNRHFGFGPKLVMRRARFLRALTAMLIAETSPDFSAVPEGYHDVPHFLRDGQDFLGMTPRRFLAIPMPYLRAALRARTQIIGAAWPPLDR